MTFRRWNEMKSFYQPRSVNVHFTVELGFICGQFDSRFCLFHEIGHLKRFTLMLKDLAG